MLKSFIFKNRNSFRFTIGINNGHIKLSIDKQNCPDDGVVVGYYDEKLCRGFALNRKSEIIQSGALITQNSDMMEDLQLLGYELNSENSDLDVLYEDIPENAKQIWGWNNFPSKDLNFQCLRLSLKNNQNQHRNIFIQVSNIQDEEDFNCHEVNLCVKNVEGLENMNSVIYL